MKIKKVILPKIYNDPEGNYPEYKGLPKVSYSQLTSFKDEKYLGDYIANYFIGLPSEGNVFSSYGSSVGNYLEYKGQNNLEGLKKLIKDGKEPDHLALLSDYDIEILNNVYLPEGSQYEFEIAIDLRPFGVEAVMQGFIDLLVFDTEDEVRVIDFKTGNITKKVEFYSGEEYYQTRLYAYALEKLGFKINYCGVELLSRKGNGMEKYPLRLEDKSETISTPYIKKQVENKLKEIAKTTIEISDMYKSYNKIFKNEKNNN